MLTASATAVRVLPSPYCALVTPLDDDLAAECGEALRKCGAGDERDRPGELHAEVCRRPSSARSSVARWREEHRVAPRRLLARAGRVERRSPRVERRARRRSETSRPVRKRVGGARREEVRLVQALGEVRLVQALARPLHQSRAQKVHKMPPNLAPRSAYPVPAVR